MTDNLILPIIILIVVLVAFFIALGVLIFLMKKYKFKFSSLLGKKGDNTLMDEPQQRIDTSYQVTARPFYSINELKGGTL